jgi:hypothetical protein
MDRQTYSDQYTVFLDTIPSNNVGLLERTDNIDADETLSYEQKIIKIRELLTPLLN